MKNESITNQSKKNNIFSFFSSISLVNKLFFTQQLEVMVRTGFSVAKALRVIAVQVENKKFKQIIEDIEKNVEKGINLSRALAIYPNVFSETYVSMVAAGEVSGKLDEVLKRLTIQMKKSHETRQKIKTALTYPIIVVITMVVIGIALVIFVLPKLTALFKETNAVLPLPTRLLIGFTDITIKYGIFILIGVIIIIGFLIQYYRSPRGKRFFHNIFLKLPILAPIIKKINLANFSRNLSSLLGTDIPIVETFKIISRTASNVLYQEYLALAAEELKKGITVTQTLEKNPKLFPALVTQIINVGEESGTLDSISEEIAIFYEAEVAETMENLAVIIEPVLMLVLGAAVAGVAVSIIMPIYSLTNQI